MRGFDYFVVMFFCLLVFMVSTEGQLQMGFYSRSCPNAEKIVQDYVNRHIHNAPSVAATIMRMHFHDCFVRGCDASVLLNTTSSGNQTEKLATPNQTLRQFDFIDRVKSLLEAACPGVVSCADVLALVARDAIVATGGPFWKVPTGRRDGTISRTSEASNNIPPPTSNFTNLRRLFANQGLNLKDLVVLSGAHTIGVAHCSSFSNRLYNFTGALGTQDPALDSEYAANLKARKCRSLNDNTTIAEMDPGSFRTFDLSYYRLLLKRRGLFQSDSALTTNSTTLSLVNRLLRGSLENFFAEFAKSMEKMGRINVKTGTVGEIRKQCAVRSRERGGNSYRARDMRGFDYFVVMFFCLLVFMGSTEGQLQMGFYSRSCPNAEKIVQDYVNRHIHNAPSVAATIIRMHFHDCFVRSDSALTTNSTTLSYVNRLLGGSLENFFAEFAKSMEKMGRINVKTGTVGEIRKQCAVCILFIIHGKRKRQFRIMITQTPWSSTDPGLQALPKKALSVHLKLLR
ncbi:hypothetical protein NC652_037690 [Populus alba x Populus x berolinensis]|nr:hypothetical protein NC652_037690 [Populus alba x Populus x berolinensis]